MLYARICTALIFSLLSSGYGQSTHARVLERTVIQQQDSPLSFVQWHGSSAAIKNVSDRRIASFVFVCVVRTGKTYKAVDSYDSSESPVSAGEFSHEGGMDATRLNACRSRKGLLAVGSVKFSDRGSWQSTLV
jgi:hypothetical protein